MDPKKVKHRYFKVKAIIFNNEAFSIAYGTWSDDHGKQQQLGMRWNGEGNGAGYPVGKFRNPTWFQIHADLTLPFLSSLKEVEGADNQKLEEILNELSSTS